MNNELQHRLTACEIAGALEQLEALRKQLTEALAGLDEQEAILRRQYELEDQAADDAAAGDATGRLLGGIPGVEPPGGS